MLYILFKKTYILTLITILILFISFSGAYAAEIILDPGHSPAQAGAISCTGEKEYLYNDALVNVIRTYLARKDIPTDVTKQRNDELSLMERARKSANKKLFISIHHDSVQPQFIKKINGQPTTEKAKGYSLFVSKKNPFFAESLEYARLIGKTLNTKGYLPSKHHGEKIKGENRELIDPDLGIYAFDDLVVLKHSKSPALLLEAGVLPNPQDEKLVRDNNFRQDIAEAIYDACKAIPKAQ